MQLPPISVRSSNIANCIKAIEHHLGVRCVKMCNLDERNIAYIHFMPIVKTSKTLEFISNLGNPFKIMFEDQPFLIESLYYDI